MCEEPFTNQFERSGFAGTVPETRNARESARKLSERLINAQEEERRRIARELHDDLNQRVALLSIEMDLLSQMPSVNETKLRLRLQRAALHISELSSELHKLAYRLHPAKLDQLGLAAAAGSLCCELSQQSGITIRFVESQIPRDLHPDVALCIYRLIQEALQNIVRHSGALSAQVDLFIDGSDLRLIISDSGIGFDSDVAHGLGLISMEERVRLVHGTLNIRSRPGLGTIVAATVPVMKKHSKLTSALPTEPSFALMDPNLSTSYEFTTCFAGG